MPVLDPLQRKLADLRDRGAPGSRLGRPHKRAGSGAARRAPADEVAAKLGYLSEIDVFAPLSGEERDWLVASTAMVTCEPGRVFYTPDEPGEVVFILKRGRVDLFRLDAEGRKLVVAALDEHTIFGEMALIGQGMYGCYAEAVKPCLICVMSRADLQRLVRRNPEVGLRLIAVLGQRLLQREAELEALAFRGLPSRLAALLLKEADRYDTVVGRSHQELAERLGTYRETVSQILGRFRNEGLIAVEPRRIRLLDRDGLEAYAGT